MTSARYLNDSSELSYGFELIDKRLSVDASKRGPIHEDFAGRMIPSNDNKGSAEAFVACFCEEGDLLSQWRGYTSGAIGYSLGFDLKLLMTLNEAGDPAGPLLKLSQVLYDRDVQERKIAGGIRYFLDAIDVKLADGGSPDDFLPLLCSVFSHWRLLTAVELKHPSFCEEREWRLVSFRSLLRFPKANKSFDDILFRVTNGCIIPYIVFDFEKITNSCVSLDSMVGYPIREVFIGPSVNSDLHCSAVELMLRKICPPASVSIKSSFSPYRSIA
jgi:hypothetical protein